MKCIFLRRGQLLHVVMRYPSIAGHAMKRSRYTEEQIAFALKQAELGTPVPEVCRKMGISDATFYAWRKKFGGLGPSELRRLK